MKRIISMITALIMTATLITANAAVSSSAEDIIKVACVGDSITAGNNSTETSKYAYPVQLQEMLGTDTYEVKNFGFGGTTALKGGKPLSYWDKDEYKQSLAYKPDIVIIMLGTNDAASDNAEAAKTRYKSEYTELINTYLALDPQPTIYLATAPETAAEPRKTNIKNIILPLQLEIAEELNLNVIHMYEESQKFFEYFSDGLHPNNMGYYYMAQVFYSQVFGGKICNVEITAEAGAEISISGFTGKVDSNGKITVPVAAGECTFIVNRIGYGTGTKTVTVTDDMSLDMTDVEFAHNLAYEATPIEDTNGRNHYSDQNTAEFINDGIVTTGWQLSGDNLNGDVVWVGYDFGEPTTFNQVTVWWESGSRAPQDGYSISYSNDGENWTNVSNFNPVFSTTTDTCKFNTVTARYVRLVIEKIQGKYFPKVFELEVYNLGGGDTPEPTKGDVNADGVINSTDCMQIRRSFLGLFELSEDAKLRADVNEDDVINSTDFMQVRRHFLNQFDLFA